MSMRGPGWLYLSGPWYLTAGYGEQAKFTTAVPTPSKIFATNWMVRFGRVLGRSDQRWFHSGRCRQASQLFKLGVGYQVTSALNVGTIST